MLDTYSMEIAQDIKEHPLVCTPWSCSREAKYLGQKCQRL